MSTALFLEQIAPSAIGFHLSTTPTASTTARAISLLNPLPFQLMVETVLLSVINAIIASSIGTEAIAHNHPDADFHIFTNPKQTQLHSEATLRLYPGVLSPVSSTTHLYLTLSARLTLKVEYISTDRLFAISADPVPPLMCADRLNAQPNLVRESTPEEHVNESPLNLQTTYRYDTSAGINQNIYVVDTGVRKDHVDLPGVQWLAQFYGSGEIDDHGHG
jgi:hypothetical protein